MIMIGDSKRNEKAPLSKTYCLEKQTDIYNKEMPYGAMHIKSHFYLCKNHPKDGVTNFYFFWRSQGRGKPKQDLKIWIAAC